MGGENMSHCSAGYENEASPGTGNNYTGTCRIDAGDQVILCEL